jgi:hypothetical protein
MTRYSGWSSWDPRVTGAGLVRCWADERREVRGATPLSARPTISSVQETPAICRQGAHRPNEPGCPHERSRPLTTSGRMACRKTGIRKVLTRHSLPTFLSGASWSRLSFPGHTLYWHWRLGGTFVVSDRNSRRPPGPMPLGGVIMRRLSQVGPPPCSAKPVTAYFPHAREAALPTDLSPMEGKQESRRRLVRRVYAVREAARRAPVRYPLWLLLTPAASIAVCFRPAAKDLA